MRAIVADVGHGNCAVIQDEGYVVMVDAAPGGIPEEMLEHLGVTYVDEVIISHADRDHIAGLPGVLRGFEVGRVWINADPARSGPAWDAVRAAVRDAATSGRTVVRAEVGAGQEFVSPGGRLLIRVVAPLGADLLFGTGQSIDGGPKLNANGLSAVVGIFVDGECSVLLPGDAGLEAFTSLRDSNQDIRSRVLVFPHHGGRPGQADPVAFASLVAGLVEPEVVIFSVGRNRSGFPRADIVAAVKAARPSTYIGCTQLVEECGHEPAPVHLHELPAQGRRDSGACCLGSVEIDLDTPTRYLPLLGDHAMYVNSLAGSPICRR
ncbi:MAG: beta-lactamase domain protein [Marmoricola sp.]|nr:beta-lactamase domain protein [Marmoricola sp.]